MKYLSTLTIFMVFVALTWSKQTLGEDYLRAKRILLMRRRMSRAATRLGDEEDAFNAQLQLITEGKAPIPLLFEPY